jgi:hypothetical protein
VSPWTTTSKKFLTQPTPWNSGCVTTKFPNKLHRPFIQFQRYHIAACYKQHICRQRLTCFQRSLIFTNCGGFKYWHLPGFLDDTSIEEKEDWLQNLLQDKEYLSDTEAYLVVLRSLATSTQPDAPMKAERWLRRLEARSVSNPDAPQPTTECYQRVIEAWGQATTEDPNLLITRTQRWLMKHLRNDNIDLRPDTACFNSFLDLCSKGRALKRAKATDGNLVKDHALKAEQTLRLMIFKRRKEGEDSSMAPNVNSFNFAIRAWTRCRRSPDIADRSISVLHLLENYEKTLDSSVRPNVKSYAMVMDSIAVVARLKVKRCQSMPKTVKNPSTNGLNEINLLQEVVSYMRNQASLGKHHLAPNGVIFNTLISCWSSLAKIHSHAPNESEKILQSMIRMKDMGENHTAPDATSYLMVMRTWLNSQQSIRAERISWWLSKQWKDYDFEGDEGLRPNTTTYNLVMRAWAEKGEPKRTEALLAELIGHSEKDRAGNLFPTSESYTLVIRAWLVLANRGDISGFETAAYWFYCLEARERDESGLVAPSEFYTLLLAAGRKCASQHPDILETAVKIFDLLRESHHRVDCLHYSSLLQIGLLALSRAEQNKVRQAFIDEIFRNCCEDGLVSSHFLQALANGPVYYDGWTVEESQRTLKRLIPCWPLPYTWTRNIRQKGFFPQRQELRRSNFVCSPHGKDPYKT